MDKLIHFGICAVTSALLTITFSPVEGVSFTAGIGIGKEVGDYMNYGKEVGNKEFAKMAIGDLLADGLGIAVGTWIGSQIKEEME